MEPAQHTMQTSPGPHVVVDGRPYLYFGGTSYLGLHDDPRILAAAAEALRRYGMGSGTSRTGCGTTPPVAEVEAEAAGWLGTEDALYLPSGWLGATVLLSALADTHDAVLVDGAAHASLAAAARAAGHEAVPYAHRDPEDLARLLVALAPRRPLVLTDGIFALTGEVAPLAALADVVAGRGGTLVVDEAHALGVLGPRGRGAAAAAGLVPGEGVRVVATASKAVGGFGGLVPAEAALVRRLRSTPVASGSSALPPSVAAGTAAALRVARAGEDLRERLRARARQLRAGLGDLSLPVEAGDVPFVALAVPNGADVARRLAEQGILVGWFDRYAGAPASLLRLAVTARHDPRMVDALLEALATRL